MNFEEKFQKYFDILELLPPLPKKKIILSQNYYNIDYEGFFINLKSQTEMIKNTQLYKDIEKYLKKKNQDLKKNIIKQFNNINNNDLLKFHIEQYINIYNILEKIVNDKNNKIKIFKEEFLLKINTLSQNDLPFECYFIYIHLMRKILSNFKIEKSDFYKEKMIEILLDDSYIFYNVKINYITDIINDNFKGISNDNQSLILKFLNVLIFLILPKNQSKNVLKNIYLCMNKLIIPFLPYTFDFMLNILIYNLLNYYNNDDNNQEEENKSDKFARILKYFSDIIKLFIKNKKIFLSRIVIGKIFILLFIIKNFDINKLSLEKYNQNLNPLNIILDEYNEEELIKIIEVSLQLFPSQKGGLFEIISLDLSKNFFNNFHEDILHIVFTTNLEYTKLFKQIKNELKDNIKIFLTNINQLLNKKKIVSNLIEFINDLFFGNIVNIDDNKKNVFIKRKIQDLFLNLINCFTYCDNSLLFKFLKKILLIYGKYFEYEWKLYCNLLFNLKTFPEFLVEKESIILFMFDLKGQDYFKLNNEMLSFILIKDQFTLLLTEKIKYELLLNSIEKFKTNFEEFFNYYTNKLNKQMTNFNIQCFYSLMNILRLYYIQNINSDIVTFIENIILTKYKIINNLLQKVQKNFWFKCLIDILVLSQIPFFIKIIQSHFEYTEFIIELIKKLNDIHSIEKIQKIFDFISDDLNRVITFISNNLYFDYENKIYFSKNDFYNKNYISYLKIKLNNENININDNNNEFAYLDINNKISEFLNLIKKEENFSKNLQIMNYQFKYMKLYFKYSNFFDVFYSFEEYLNKIINDFGNDNQNKKIIFNYIVNILSSIPFNFDSPNSKINFQTFYHLEKKQMKIIIYTFIQKFIKSLFLMTNKKNEAKNKLKEIENYLIKTISLLEIYIISINPQIIAFDYYWEIFITYFNFIQTNFLLNFEILKFFYICRENIINQDIKNNNIKIVLYLLLIFSIKKIPQNIQNIIYKELKINIENVKKNKNEENLFNHDFTDFGELIISSYLEYDKFKIEYINLLKECPDKNLDISSSNNSTLIELMLLKLFTDIPRSNINEDEKEEKNSMFFYKNKGFFEIFEKKNNDSFNIISRKGIYSIMIKVSENKNTDKIIIKNKENKMKILDTILNQKKKIEINNLISEEKYIENTLENKFKIFLESFSPFNDEDLKQINKKENDFLQKFDNLSTYFSFKCSIIYLKENEDISYNYKNIFETNVVSDDFISFLNSLGNIKYKDDNLQYINFKNSCININFELIQFDNIEKINYNNYDSCIIFFENPNIILSQNILQKLLNFSFLIIIYPLYDSHYLIEIKENKKKEVNMLNFLENLNIYVKDNYSIMANLLIKYIVCMSYYSKIDDENNENNSLHKKVLNRLLYIQKISEKIKN